jgi:hypothetical protein
MTCAWDAVLRGQGQGSVPLVHQAEPIHPLLLRKPVAGQRRATEPQETARDVHHVEAEGKDASFSSHFERKADISIRG